MSANKKIPVQSKPEPKQAGPDGELNEKRKDRGYNPIDQAKRGSVSAELNVDASKYKKGPSIN